MSILMLSIKIVLAFEIDESIYNVRSFNPNLYHSFFVIIWFSMENWKKRTLQVWNNFFRHKSLHNKEWKGKSST